MEWERILIKLDIPYKKKASGAIKILCPHHHEKTPSMVMRSTGFFICYGCKFAGNKSKFIRYHLFEGVWDLGAPENNDPSPSSDQEVADLLAHLPDLPDPRQEELPFKP